MLKLKSWTIIPILSCHCLCALNHLFLAIAVVNSTEHCHLITLTRFAKKKYPSFPSPTDTQKWVHKRYKKTFCRCSKALISHLMPETPTENSAANIMFTCPAEQVGLLPERDNMCIKPQIGQEESLPCGGNCLETMPGPTHDTCPTYTFLLWVSMPLPQMLL